MTISSVRIQPKQDFAAKEAVYRHLTSVLTLSQENPHVFGSPLGLIEYEEQHAWLPRFVFFGPGTTNESWRLSFLAALDWSDLRASHALLGFVEHLARFADEGYGLHLTFFPLVDVAGHVFDARGRTLAKENWARSKTPELALLERDARNSRYHGFVRLETSEAAEDSVVLRMRAPVGVSSTPDVEFLSSDDFESFPIRFETGGVRSAPEDGPLTIAEDLSVQPFELTLRIPSGWTEELYERAVNAILGRFILRFRAFQAFGGHL